MNKLVGVALLSTLIFVSTINSSAQTEVCTKHLILKEASQAKWNPGIVKSNSESSGGKTFEVRIKVRKQGYLTIENLITENEVISFEVIQNGNRNAKGPFKKGDELLIVGRTDRKKQESAPAVTLVDMLRSEKAAGAIVYRFRDQTYLHPITQFAEKQSNKLSE